MESSERGEVTNTTETFRNFEDGMWRWTYSTDVVCSALSCKGWAANLSNLMNLRMSCRETIGERNSVSPCNEELNWIFLL